MNTVGSRIKSLRVERGLTQPELAELCGWGYHQGRISHYETGKRRPALTDLKVIAKALKVDIKDLIDDESFDLEEVEENMIRSPKEKYDAKPSNNKNAALLREALKNQIDSMSEGQLEACFNICTTIKNLK